MNLTKMPIFPCVIMLNVIMSSVIMLNVIMLYVILLNMLNIIISCVIMLNVIMMNVMRNAIMLNAIMLNVVMLYFTASFHTLAPFRQPSKLFLMRAKELIWVGASLWGKAGPYPVWPDNWTKFHPTFGNVAKTVAKTLAKILKLKSKVQNVYTQLFLKLKNVQQTIFATAYLAENVKKCWSKQ